MSVENSKTSKYEEMKKLADEGHTLTSAAKALGLDYETFRNRLRTIDPKRTIKWKKALVGKAWRNKTFLWPGEGGRR